jgi:hypothetical protein
MRLHGIYVQGLRCPSGQQRVTVDPGYNLWVVPDVRTGESLAALLRGLLYPETELGDLASWIDETAAVPPRAALSYSLDGQAYRLVVDFENRRLLLGRYDRETRQYARVSTRLAEVANHLRAAGLPGREELLELHWCHEEPTHEAPDLDTGLEPATDPTSEPAAPVPAEAVGAAAAVAPGLDREEISRRLSELRNARERLDTLEKANERLLAEIETRSTLAGSLEDLDERVASFRELYDKRNQEHGRVERARNELLEERSRLRLVPASQRSWMWLGLALGASSAVAALLFDPLFHILSVVGAVLALAALAISRNARRRLGHVEARLAALRVRERSVERHFEEEGAQIRSLLHALDLASVEDLEREAKQMRDLMDEAAEQKSDLETARAAYPPQAETELLELERRLEELEAGPAAVSASPHQPPEAGIDDGQTQPDLGVDRNGVLAPERLIGYASSWCGRGPQELRTLARLRLTPYLRSLLGRVYERLDYRVAEGWTLHRRGESQAIGLDEITSKQRFLVCVALRLALIEALAETHRAPLVIGPVLPPLEEAERLSLARALKRIGTLTQVLQIATDNDPWCDRASNTHHWVASTR